ncbi:MAG: hypothetical protein V4717_21180 [Bacteroidota bacterium]
MNKCVLSIFFCFTVLVTTGQTPLKVINDSVVITNAELIIRNSTKNVQGFLYNTGNGLTQFKSLVNYSPYQVELTKTELDQAITSSTLKPGMNYRISGVCSTLYGGTDIIVSAVTTNSISINGEGLFFNPNYRAYAFYDTDSTYAVGDTATWGGFVWVNTSGNLGTGTDVFTLSSDWNKLPYDSIRYVPTWDDIRYNYKKDDIFYRRDNLNNEVSCDSTSLEVKWYYPFYTAHPIKAFKWGSPKIYNNTIRESYAEFINIDTASRVNGNTITNRSYFRSNKLVNCYFAGNIFEQYVRVENNTWKTADISYNTMSEGRMSNNWVEAPYSYDFVQGASIFYNDIDKGVISNNKIITNAGGNGYIANNAGLGNITDCYITSGQITSNYFAYGGIVKDTIIAGGRIESNFIFGNGTSSLITDCNLSTNVHITGNHIMLGGKISRSSYGVSNCSIQTFTLTPAVATSSRSYIGSTSLYLPLPGYGANKMLTVDASGSASWAYPSNILGGTTSTSSISYQTTSASGTTGADHIFKVGNNGATEAMRILNNGNIGIGTSPVAKLHLLNTSEQLRIGYDTTNYLSFNVGNTGLSSINAVGTSAALTLNGSSVTIQQAAVNKMTFNSSSSTTGIINITSGSGSTAGGLGFNIGSGTYSSTSGIQYPVALLPTINQTGTAGYTALLISPKETATGSGLKTLLDLGTNSDGTTTSHNSVFKVDNSGKITFNATNIATGTTGAQTINKPAGSVNFAASAQTLVVSNATVLSSSMVFLIIESNDATATSAYISSKSAGSFTIKLNAAATAETRVNFIVFN